MSIFSHSIQKSTPAAALAKKNDLFYFRRFGLENLLFTFLTLLAHSNERVDSEVFFRGTTMRGTYSGTAL